MMPGRYMDKLIGSHIEATRNSTSTTQIGTNPRLTGPTRAARIGAISNQRLFLLRFLLAKTPPTNFWNRNYSYWIREIACQAALAIELIAWQTELWNSS